MYSFDGDYRRRPIQNLGGRSQNNDRDTIIRKAQRERQKRNELRRQNNGAIVLQSYARSFIERQRKKNSERELFDQYYQVNKNELANEKNLEFLLKRLTFFYSKSNQKDCERLINICQCLIRNPQKPLTKSVSDASWLHRMKRCLLIWLEQLTVPNIPQAIPLRMLETFTTDSAVGKYLQNSEHVGKYLSGIFKFLVERKYFKVIRNILEDKCPPLDGVTLQPPNQFTDALYQLLVRPLALLNRGVANGTYIPKSFVEQILKPEFSEPIQFFILPCLSRLKEFPFANLLNYLEDIMARMSIDNEETSKKGLSTFVLYSVLTLDQLHLEKLNNVNLLTSYIRLISEIRPNVLNLAKSTKVFSEDEADSSDSDSEEKPFSTISVIEQNCLLESIEMVNEVNRAFLLDATLAQCGRDVQASVLERFGVPRIIENEDHLQSLKYQLHTNYLPKIHIFEWYQRNVTAYVNKLIEEAIGLRRSCCTQTATSVTTPILSNPPQQASPVLGADAITPASLQLLQQLQAVGLRQQLLQGIGAQTATDTEV